MAIQSDRFGLDMFDEDERYKEEETVAGEGDPDGHNPLVKLVDEFMVDHGPLSERPASGDYDMEIYLAVDESELYAWDEGSSAWNLLLTISHDGLLNVNPDDHHSRYTDSEAITAVEGEDPLSLSGALNVGGDVDVNGDISVDRIKTQSGDGPYDIQKDGTDGVGVINFKTEE